MKVTTMTMHGTPLDLMAMLATPEFAQATFQIGDIPSKILPYQAAALHTLARGYNYPGASILEIGTFAGYSAALLALAAPQATVITLNPAEKEFKEAAAYLSQFPNVHPLQYASWDYLWTQQSARSGRKFDLIFVDGDHRQIERDLPWFNQLKSKGLILFHDYTPAGVPHGCPPVYEAVNKLARILGKGRPDVVITDSNGIGMAGIYAG